MNAERFGANPGANSVGHRNGIIWSQMVMLPREAEAMLAYGGVSYRVQLLKHAD